MLIINQTYRLNLLSGFIENLSTGHKASLGTNETALLQYMVDNPHRALSKSELLEHVWHQKGVIVEESSLLHCVSSCRKAIGDSGEIITTVRGVGYQFNGQVSSEEEGEEVPEPAPQPEILQPQVVEAEESQIKKRNLICISLFTLAAVVSFALFSFTRSPWVQADYQEQRFIGCTIQANTQDKPIVMTNVRMFTTNNQVILVDTDGHSISYLVDEVEVQCE